MRELLIATTNPGKLEEMLSILDSIPCTIMSLRDVESGQPVEEPAETYEGNAIIKAFTYGKRTGKLTLAEDTGLDVDALPGKLGVRTARYDTNDDTRNQKLLKEMTNINDENRGATFTTVVAIYDPINDLIRTCSGQCRGKIMHDLKGDHGFGFSTLFYVDETGKRLAEMSFEELRTVNHRGKAMLRARETLLAEYL